MKNVRNIFLILILVLGLSLAACGGSDTDTTEEIEATEVPTVVEDTPLVEEPTDPEPEPTVAPVVEEPVVEETVVDLDDAYGFLGSMTAYNTTGLEDTNLALIEDPLPFLLDVRQPEEAAEKGHIESAVLIPLRELGQHLDQLPSFDTPIIAYCGSGWRATIAMTALQALGWEDVKVLKGGSFGGWVEAGYPVVAGEPPAGLVLNAAEPDAGLVAIMDDMLSNIPEGWGGIANDALNLELIENPDIILIDVRRTAEVTDKGYIDAANAQVNVPIEEMVLDQSLWPADKEAEIVIYCGSGHRSTMAMSILRSYGYNNVRSLKGGFGDWVSAGFPTAGGAVAMDNAFNNFLGSMTAYNTMSLEDANLALLGDPPPFLLDVRNVAEAEEKGHIESAVLIPLRELGQNLQYLPGFDTPIIVYCGSGWRATIAMTALQAMGWEDVKVLTGGSFGGWVEAGYPVIEGVPQEALVLDVAEPDPAVWAKVDNMLTTIPEGWGGVANDVLNLELIENSEIILIDVRREGEVAEKGFIEAANAQTNIPIEQFIAMQSEWPADKDAEIVIYCGSGHRSTMAMSILGSYGYTNVRSLKGGFGGWAGAGFPVTQAVSLDVVFDDFLANMEAYNTISLEDVNLALIEDPPPFLLDVRNASEAEEKGHIESAVLIPLRELGQNLQYLPSYDTPVVVYCGSGWRATIAMTALQAMGWTDVKVMTGGSYGGWLAAGYPVVAGVPQEGLVLDVAAPDAGILAQIDTMLSSLPENWAGVANGDLNLELIENPEVILIDVRRTGELEEKGIIAADNTFVHIPIEELISQIDAWPADKEAEIVIYCGSGHRSTIAMSILRSYGYSNVRSLKAGFGGWVEAGLPVAEAVLQ